MNYNPLAFEYSPFWIKVEKEITYKWILIDYTELKPKHITVQGKEQSHKG